MPTRRQTRARARAAPGPTPARAAYVYAYAFPSVGASSKFSLCAEPARARQPLVQRAGIVQRERIRHAILVLVTHRDFPTLQEHILARVIKN